MTMDISGIIRSILQFAGAQYPLHILGGLSGGILTSALVKTFAAGAQKGTFIYSAAHLPDYYYCIAGVFFSVLYIIVFRKKVDEKTVRDLARIELIFEKANLNEFEQRQAWRALLQTCVDSFRPDGNKSIDVGSAAKDAVKSVSDRSLAGDPSND